MPGLLSSRHVALSDIGMLGRVNDLTVTIRRLSCFLALILSGSFFCAPAFAECGGTQQCIGVSTDPTVPPEHSLDGVNRPAPTLDFGTQAAASATAARTILVAAVEGPAGTRATLDAITLTGTNATDFRITGGTCTVGTPTLLHDGNRVAQISNACTITVTFNPAAVGVKTAQVNVQTTAITRVAPLTGTGTPTPTGPSSAAATLNAPVNSSATLQLAPFITGIVTGVSIVTAPAHGMAVISGTSVTYTPNRDYFGTDSFTFAAFNSVGSSAPAAISVTVTGRPDPSKNVNVIGLIGAQAQTVRRFTRAQISNFQGRMESLHARAGGGESANAAGFGAGRGTGSNRDSVPELYRNSYENPVAGIRSIGAVAEANGGDQQASRIPGAAAEPAALRQGGLMPPGFMNTLVTAATARSLNLASSSDRTDGSGGLPKGTGVWMAGIGSFGTRDQTSDSNGLRFTTDGISAGIDRRFSDKLALGMGIGYARDETRIGGDGTDSKSRGASVSTYGSYRPTANTFVDGLLGYGVLRYDTDRFVASAADFARARRTGNQVFASIAAGYEHRSEALLLSPYGRLDLGRDKLKQATETGAGLNALTYYERTLPMVQLSLGLRVESRHETGFGWALPRLRLEFRHNFEGNPEATIAYADDLSGPRYAVTPAALNSNALLVGFGSDFVFRDGLKLGIDYQTQRLSGADHNQAIRFWLSKELDGKPSASRLWSSNLFTNPVRVEAAYTFDDNLNRARDAGGKLSDRIYSLNVSKGTSFPVTDHTRVLLAGFLNGDKMYTFTGLDRLSGGVQGELQYRTSAEFDAPTFGIFGRASRDEYDSRIRSGSRYSIGATVRQSLTDRIDLFGSLANNARHAESAVFDAKDYALRLNLDYSLGRAGALYLGGEYRRGDSVSSAPTSAGYGSSAKAFVEDVAFGDRQLTAYRYDARIVLWTLGYNRPLGPMDSIDFSWRRAESTPTGASTAVGYAAAGTTGNSRYTANQYSIAYLMRF